VTQQVNLYQPIFRRQEKKFSARAMVQAIGLVAGGIVLMVLYTYWQIGSLRSELARAEAQQAAAAKRLDEVTRQFAGQVRPRSIDEQLAQIEAEIGAKQRVYDILRQGAFTNTGGFSAYLTAFARTGVPGVWLTGIDVVGAAEQMTLKGRSLSRELVPRYVQRLGAEPRLAGVEFQTFVLARGGADGKPLANAEVEFELRTGAAAGRKP
jgi:Tfp pilus assembly protein PilN